jgi:threonine synthase
MERFETTGELQLPPDILEKMSQYHTAISVSDETTLATIQRIFENEGYLLDPHGAVALAGAESCASIFGQSVKTICLATAHPAKFPNVIAQAVGSPLPQQAFHPSLQMLSIRPPEAKSCPLPELYRYLVAEIEQRNSHG